MPWPKDFVLAGFLDIKSRPKVSSLKKWRSELSHFDMEPDQYLQSSSPSRDHYNSQIHHSN
jgi:hypothetical protein